MIVVSGCPRSGTSLMMDLMRVALGDDRIVGNKWPQDRTPDSPHVAACIDYIRDKQQPGWREQLEHSKHMNPNGFYECRWTVQGIQYTPEPPPSDHVVKIVSNGLAASNPQYIDKIVMMVRHPWNVANSHRDLTRPGPGRMMRNQDIGDISPDMYCRVTAMAARWIDRHKPDIMLVAFEDLIADPQATLERVASFVGDGDWQTAAKQIEPKLKRSAAEQQNDHPSWALSLDIHAAVVDADWPRVVSLYEEHQGKQAKPVRFFCPRWGGEVNRTMCGNCHGDDTARGNMIKTAEKRNVAWEDEPCLWECGMNPDGEYTPLTIEQSIQANHWRQTADPKPPPTMPPDADIRLAEQRAAVCETCEHGSNVRLTIESKRGIYPVYRVSCKLCSSCGNGMSLIKGKCKLDKWNKPPEAT